MVQLLYVFGLVAAFGAFWLLVAALQTFTDAQPARVDNIVGTVVCALVAAGLFWLARRLSREVGQPTRDGVPVEEGHGVSANR